MTAPQSWLRYLIVFAVVEVIGISVGIAGLAVEFVYGADGGFLLITGGGLVFGAGSGLWAKVYKGQRR